MYVIAQEAGSNQHGAANTAYKRPARQLQTKEFPKVTINPSRPLCCIIKRALQRQEENQSSACFCDQHPEYLWLLSVISAFLHYVQNYMPVGFGTTKKPAFIKLYGTASLKTRVRKQKKAKTNSWDSLWTIIFSSIWWWKSKSHPPSPTLTE